MGALSLTASRSVQRKGFGTLLSGVFHMPYPDTYRGTYGVSPENASADCLSYLENELFRRRVDPEEVAGIFIEPIQGEGGYILAPAEFLQGLQKICTQVRNHAGGGRSAVGHGPHGQVVGGGLRRRRAGHHLHREGNCFGHAAERGDRARQRDGLEAGRARVDVRRESGVHRGFAGDAALAGRASTWKTPSASGTSS